MPTVVVVGGGISGLTLAYYLERLRRDIAVTVLESQPTVGGVIRTESAEGYRVEAGPNGFLDNKSAVLDLCRELNLESRLLPASEAAGRNRYLFLNGRLQLLPTGLFSFLRSNLLSWRAKLALLTERFRRRGPGVPDESVDSFARRRVGAEIAETLADAFVTGIHAGDPKLLSVQAAFPRLHAFERDYGSVTRGMRKHRALTRHTTGKSASRVSGRMWSFPGGLRVLIDALRSHLQQSPRTGVPVSAIRRLPDKWEVRSETGESWQADAVVLACPAYRQESLLTSLDSELAALIGSIPYNRVAVVALGFRTADVPDKLEGFGYLSPQRTRRDVLGVQWCSSIYPGQRSPPNMVLLRAICGGWHRPEVVDWDDDRLTAAVRAELRQTLRIETTPIFRRVIHWDRAIPQYHLGHLDRVARAETRATTLHSGLFLGGSAYHGIALPDCVEQAKLLAERVGTWLNSN